MHIYFVRQDLKVLIVHRRTTQDIKPQQFRDLIIKFDLKKHLLKSQIEWILVVVTYLVNMIFFNDLIGILISKLIVWGG